MDPSEERIGLNGAAVVLDVPAETVRGFVDGGRLRAERDEEGGLSFNLAEVMELAREMEAAEEIFEGEVIGDDAPGSSRLPAVPFERYERLLQQGQDYK
ncbi:MAG: hypothetical protein ICV58_08645, partial [Rubrobacteraceae bacterium]|nr:hypothetical protein [Rubrobacteraceae bacterium]